MFYSDYKDPAKANDNVAIKGLSSGAYRLTCYLPWNRYDR